MLLHCSPGNGSRSSKSARSTIESWSGCNGPVIGPQALHTHSHIHFYVPANELDTLEPHAQRSKLYARYQSQCFGAEKGSIREQHLDGQRYIFLPYSLVRGCAHVSFCCTLVSVYLLGTQLKFNDESAKRRYLVPTLFKCQSIKVGAVPLMATDSERCWKFHPFSWINICNADNSINLLAGCVRAFLRARNLLCATY